MVLQRMRVGAQGLVAKVVVGVIVFVLAVTGFGAIQFFSGGEPTAATVNGDDISQRTLEVETSRRRALQRSQLGPEVSDEVLELLVNRRDVLESLIVNTLVGQLADELNLSISESAVQQSIRESFAGVEGFDDGMYRNWLAGLGHTPSTYQAEQAALAVQSQVGASLSETGFVTTRELSRGASILGQRRDIAYLLFGIESFVDDIEVGEAEIEEHYARFLDDYMTQEQFEFDYVRLPRNRLEDDVVVTEADVELAFQDEIANLAEPRRHAAHILLTVNDARSAEEARAVLEQARSEIENGASFEDRARELSEDPDSAERGGDVGSVGKGIFPAPFEEALWALYPGDISEPIQTEFGVHLVKLIDIEESEIPTLEERRADIVASLRRGEAEQGFENLVREMDEIAFEEGDSLGGLVQQYGLEVENVGGVTGLSRDGIFADDGVRQAAFSDDVLVDGFNSAAVATTDAAVVLRLRTRYPSMEQSLDDVREEIRGKIAREQARMRAEEAAFEAFASLADGATPTEIARTTRIDWQRADGVTRNAGEVPNEILALAFEMTAPAPGERRNDVASLADGSRALVVLSNVALGDYSAMNETDRVAMARSLEQLAARQDLGALVRTLRSGASVNSIDFDG